MRAANFLYNVAPRDGTVIGGLHGAVLTAPLLSPAAASFDVTRFSWIGNVTRDTYVGYVWHTAPVQALVDARSQVLVLGGTSVGGNGIDMAIVARDVFGFKIKIVSGYKTSAETKIALERGEIDGTFANLWTSLKQTDWLAKGLVRVIVQHGTQKHPELPTVPLFRDFASDDAERQMLDVWACARRSPGPIWRRPGFPRAPRLVAPRLRRHGARSRLSRRHGAPAIGGRRALERRGARGRGRADRQDAACRGAADGHAVRQLQGWALREPRARPRQADHSPRVTHLSHRGGS